MTHAFTNPSKQFRRHVKPRLLSGLYHTSLYRRLILQASKDGARLNTTSAQITTRRRDSPKQASLLLKFLWGQLYNGKLAFRYGHQPTPACRLCGAPDSCTHIAGACPANTSHIIKKHNAAVQLVHAAIRQASKGGAALHRSPLTLISCDAGNISQTTSAQLAALLTDDAPEPPPLLPTDTSHLLDLLDPDLFKTVDTRNYTDVSIEAKIALSQLYQHTQTDTGNHDPINAPSYLPDWVLPHTTSNFLRQHNHGVAPDLVYARGVPNSSSPDPTSFNKSSCSLLLIEIGFSADLNLKTKLEEKTRKYQPLIEELRKHWGSVNLVCIPIGHAGTLLGETAVHLAKALATRRPNLSGGKRKSTKENEPDVDLHALQHDTALANRLLQQLSNLAATRLLQLLAHRQAELQRLTPDSPPPFAPRKRKSESLTSAIT
jgi:hypothetical protein